MAKVDIRRFDPASPAECHRPNNCATQWTTRLRPMTPQTRN